jgi:hypothetical protein
VGVPGGVLVAGEDLGSWRRGRAAARGCFTSAGEGDVVFLFLSTLDRIVFPGLGWAGPSFLLYVFFFFWQFLSIPHSLSLIHFLFYSYYYFRIY